MSELKTITINKRAHYRLSGSLTDPTTLLLVFHGYAQLAEFFIEKPKRVVDQHTLVVAPEGTHHFYYGEQKRAGACWMTSLYREEDIHENNTFLNEVFETIKNKFPTIERVNVLGFSQGVAVALRWLSRFEITLCKLILWAGNLPVDFCTLSRINPEECYFVHGDRDSLRKNFLRSKETLQKEYGVKFKKVIFKGGHIVNPKVLRELLNTRSVEEKIVC